MNAQALQGLIVGLCVLAAAGWLLRKYLPRLRGSCNSGNSCKGCGKGGGCH